MLYIPKSCMQIQIQKFNLNNYIKFIMKNNIIVERKVG